MAQAVENIRSSVTEACSYAKVGPGDLTAASIAVAGISHPSHFHAMDDSLRRALEFEFELVTDADAALEGALGGKPGVVVIAGTGSIAIGVNERGEEARAGGWGPTIGDEGSGYDIARQTLRAFAASLDGRAPVTILVERICRRLRITDPADLPGVIYEDGPPEPVEVAPLAEVTGDAALDGDPVARRILFEAGTELGRLATAVIRRLQLTGSVFRVACVGSVFNSGEFVIAALRDAVAEAAPNAGVGPPIFSPAIGAARLARRRWSQNQ
jgi:N-acetylglucosamine kinase-like BadF-type ATPase